jgi:hypothetical protein
MIWHPTSFFSTEGGWLAARCQARFRKKRTAAAITAIAIAISTMLVMVMLYLQKRNRKHFSLGHQRANTIFPLVEDRDSVC